MKDFVVTGRAFDIPVGVKVRITRDQYAPRKHALKPADTLPEKWEKAVFITTAPIQFKKDEQVSTDLDVGKSQMVEIVPVKLTDDPKENDAAIAAAKAKAAPAAAAKPAKK